jgi:Fe-S cluster biosynthesis and repair protein YggX
MLDKCKRCGRGGDGAPPNRVPFSAEVKEQVVTSICAACWAEWEGVEVKVINEYRLNFMDPTHRKQVQQACLDFLGLPQA